LIDTNLYKIKAGMLLELIDKVEETEEIATGKIKTTYKLIF
jgi:hypothetical protein